VRALGKDGGTNPLAGAFVRGCDKSTGLPDPAAAARLSRDRRVRVAYLPRLPNNDVDAYIVVEDFGALGCAYVETELDAADRESIIRAFISGEYENALRVVSFNIAEGWSRDVSEDIAGKIIDRAYDADETLTEGTMFHRQAHNPRRKTAAGAVGQTRAASGCPQEGIGRIDIWGPRTDTGAMGARTLGPDIKARGRQVKGGSGRARGS
jgi:hypothetical protein